MVREAKRKMPMKLMATLVMDYSAMASRYLNFFEFRQLEGAVFNRQFQIFWFQAPFISIFLYIEK